MNINIINQTELRLYLHDIFHKQLFGFLNKPMNRDTIPACEKQINKAWRVISMNNCMRQDEKEYVSRPRSMVSLVEEFRWCHIRRNQILASWLRIEGLLYQKIIDLTTTYWIKIHTKKRESRHYVCTLKFKLLWII